MKRLLAVLFLVAPVSAAADAEQQSAANAALQEKASAASEVCKTTLDVGMDWSSFAGKNAQYFDDAAIGEYCGTVVEAVGSYCQRSERHQQGVAEALESITCRFDPKATREKLDRTDVTWSLKKKKAVVGYNAETREHGQVLRVLYWEFAFERNGSVGEEAYLTTKLQEEFVQPANEACGKKLSVEITWPKFRKFYKLEKGSERTAYNVQQTCGGVVRTIADWCSSSEAPRAKAAKKKLDKLTCTWDAKANRKKLKRPGASHKLKGKHFIVGWNWDTENPGQEVNDFFIAKFKIKDPNVASSGPCKGKSGRALLACQRRVEGGPNKCYADCAKRFKPGTGLSGCRAQCRK